MENNQNNSSNDSSSGNKSPPSSGDTQAPNSTNDNQEVVMKTPWQVLMELGGYSDNNGGGEGGSVGGGAPVAAAVGCGGSGSTVVEGVVAATEELQAKKRKAPVVRDPPRGKPSCPICNREFPSWKSAFGHMRAHPNRHYRGFFMPPVFASPSSSSAQVQPQVTAGDGAKKSGDDNLSDKIVQAFAFDLNEPLLEEGESSHVAEPAEGTGEEEGKGLELDLNKIPPHDDDA